MVWVGESGVGYQAGSDLGGGSRCTERIHWTAAKFRVDCPLFGGGMRGEAMKMLTMQARCDGRRLDSDGYPYQQHWALASSGALESRKARARTPR